jgi:hypothetical protein
MVSVSVQTGTRSTRKFYIGIGLLGVLFAFVGFWPSYFGPVFFEAAEKAAILHIHAAVFVGWLALFTTQAYLAAIRRVDLHIRVGRFGIGYGALVIVVGLTTGFIMSAGYVTTGDFIGGSDLLYSTVLDMGIFTPFFVAAVLFRKRPELHKRLMIIAGTSLLVAAVFRMEFLGRPRNVWLAHTIWLSPLILTMCADYWKRRVIHPVLLIGVIGLMLQSPAFRDPVRRTETWRSFSGWLLDFVA